MNLYIARIGGLYYCSWDNSLPMLALIWNQPLAVTSNLKLMPIAGLLKASQ